MSLLLIRHGETALNVARVLQPAATPLGERGLRQAEAVARRLAGEGLVAIVSSDLPRALRTAEAIAAATGAPIETTALLHERNFGDWRGRRYDELGFDPLATSDAPPGGESADAFAQRVALAFAHVVARRAAARGPVAVVTHGLVLRRLLEAHLRGAPGVAVPEHFGNTGVTRIDAVPPHAVTLLDCTRHLDAALGDDARALSGG